MKELIAKQETKITLLYKDLELTNSKAEDKEKRINELSTNISDKAAEIKSLNNNFSSTIL